MSDDLRRPAASLPVAPAWCQMGMPWAAWASAALPLSHAAALQENLRWPLAASAAGRGLPGSQGGSHQKQHASCSHGRSSWTGLGNPGSSRNPEPHAFPQACCAGLAQGCWAPWLHHGAVCVQLACQAHQSVLRLGVALPCGALHARAASITERHQSSGHCTNVARSTMMHNARSARQPACSRPPALPPKPAVDPQQGRQGGQQQGHGSPGAQLMSSM